MIANLLLAVLHLLAYLLVLRLILPKQTLFLNPYAMAMERLLMRLLNVLHSAIPLSLKPLCGVVLGLVLASRAALLATTGAPELMLSGFAIANFNVSTFGGWLGVECLHFVGFYLSVVTGTFFLRCWHRGQRLPGYSGDLLLVASYPFGRFSLPKHGVFLLLMTVCYVGVVVLLLSSMTYPFAELMPIQQETLAQPNIEKLFEFSRYSPLIHGLLLVGTTFLEALATLQESILILLFMLLLSVLFGSGPMTQFLFDLKTLLCGPIRGIRIGMIDLSLLVTYFVLIFSYTLLVTILMMVAVGLSYVV